MRSKFLFLCLFLFGMLTACKDTKWVDVPTGTPPEGSVTGKPVSYTHLTLPTNREV